MRLLLLLAFFALSSGSALANGLTMPTQVKQGFGGFYILRGQVHPTYDITKLRYGIFTTTKEMTVDKPVEGVSLRPNVITARANSTRTFVAVIPGSAPLETPLALCLWREDAKPTSSESSQLLVQFRFCRFFTLLPKHSSMATP